MTPSGETGSNVRVSGAVARGAPGVVVEPVSCGVMGWVPPWWQPRADGVRPHSLWWARQARGMCGGDGTAMCGEPRAAAECTCTEREFGRCSRPTVRPGRTVNDNRDQGDGSSTRPRGWRTSGSLTETSVRDWPYWPARFDGSADRTMNPCRWTVPTRWPGTSSPRASSQTDRSTPMAIRPWSSTDARPPAFLSGGEAARPWDAASGARVRRPRRRRCSWQRLVAQRSHDPDVAWRVNGLAAQSGIEPSGP